MVGCSCPICGLDLSARTADQVGLHVSQAHTDMLFCSQLLACPFAECPYRTRAFGHFKRHLRFHSACDGESHETETGDAPDAFACSGCDRGYHKKPNDVLECAKARLTYDPDAEVTCPFLNCGYRLVNSNCFAVHVSRRHRNDTVLTPYVGTEIRHSGSPEMGREGCDVPSPTEGTQQWFEFQEDHSDADPLPEIDFQPDLDKVMKLVSCFILQLKIQARVPDYKIPDIIDRLIELESQSVVLMKHNLEDELKSAKLKGTLPSAFVATPSASDLVDVSTWIIRLLYKDGGVFGKFCSKSKAFGSVYRLKEYVKTSLPYLAPVNPLELAAPPLEDADPADPYEKPIGAYFQLEKDLQNFIGNECVAAAVRESFEISRSPDGTYRSHRDGSFYESLPNSGNRPVIDIALYVDDFDPSASLQKSYRCKAKAVGIYYSVLNLPAHYRSKAKSIRVLSLLLSRSVVGVGGYHTALDRIVKDIKKLEDGVYFEKLGCTATVRLAFVVADNAAAHELLNLAKAWTGYCCRLCLVQYSDLNDPRNLSVTHPKLAPEYPKRTRESVASDLKNLQGSCQASHSRSVKGPSVLDQLGRFSFDLIPCDIGHDLFEGVCKEALLYAFKRMTSGRTGSQHSGRLITWKEIPERIRAFTSRRGYAENSTSLAYAGKSSCISNDSMAGTINQTYHLIRAFPLIFGDLFGNDVDSCPTFKYLMLVRQIVLIVRQREISENQVVALEGYIRESVLVRNRIIQLHVLRKLPPPSVKPKHHFLEHLPEIIRKYGPPGNYDTTRFESIHSTMKRSVQMAHNFINVIHTMASEYQLRSAVQLVDQNFLRDKMQFEFDVPNGDVNPNDTELMKSALKGKPFLGWTRRLQVGKGLEYRTKRRGQPDSCVVTRVSKDALYVGLILGISPSGADVFFLLDNYETEFDSDLGGFLLVGDPERIAVARSRLVDPQPVHCYLVVLKAGEKGFLVLPRALLCQHLDVTSRESIEDCDRAFSNCSIVPLGPSPVKPTGKPQNLRGEADTSDEDSCDEYRGPSATSSSDSSSDDTETVLRSGTLNSTARSRPRRRMRQSSSLSKAEISRKENRPVAPTLRAASARASKQKKVRPVALTSPRATRSRDQLR